MAVSVMRKDYQMNNLNTELQYLAQDYYEDQADLAWTDPRWNGPDWDWNEGLWYWENVK
jgi:hypothetical protein